VARSLILDPPMSTTRMRFGSGMDVEAITILILHKSKGAGQY
jgi:hypothetical protein